jgi:hypothetical protein
MNVFQNNLWRSASMSLGFAVFFAAMVLVPIEVVGMHILNIGSGAVVFSDPENETKRAQILLPISIPEGTEDDLGSFGNFNVVNMVSLVVGRYSIIKTLAHEDLPRCFSGAFDFLPFSELHVIVRKKGGGFSVVRHIDAKESFPSGPSHDIATTGQIRPFNIGERFGGPGGSDQRFVGTHLRGAPQPPCIPRKGCGSEEQGQSEDSDRIGAFYKVPLSVFFLVLIVSSLSGFGLCVWGWDNVYNNRIAVGAALIGAGFLTGLGGLIVAALTPMQWAVAW